MWIECVERARDRLSLRACDEALSPGERRQAVTEIALIELYLSRWKEFKEDIFSRTGERSTVCTLLRTIFTENHDIP